MSDTREDFLGQTYGVGDTIVYAAMSGRSVNMVKARVVSFNESGSVTVRPIESARWKQHSGQTRFIDSRTGKGIDPWRGNGKHIKTEPHYRNKVTGETADSRAVTPLGRYEDWEYVGIAFNDYVQEVRTETRPVTLTVTRNIVKVESGADA